MEAHLRYPHCWVWLTASQLFGQLFAAHKPEELVAVWRGEATGAPPPASATAFIAGRLDKKVKLKGSPPLVFSRPLKGSLTQMFFSFCDVQMRELALSFCHQLQSKFLDTASGEQV